MKKIVIIDLVNGCESWCRDNIRGDVHLYDVLSIDTLTNIVNYPDADYILVFESDVRDYLTNIFNMLKWNKKKDGVIIWLMRRKPLVNIVFIFQEV